MYKFLLLFLGSISVLAQEYPTTTFVLDGTILAQNRHFITDKSDAKKVAAFQNLKQKADKVLSDGKIYTVMHKKQVPPSGNKHDYMSMGPYWWPDPSKPNGLPYIRKDGERNPEYYEISDSEEMDELENDVETLALAYYYGKDEKYANFAVKLIKTWFLDSATRQNPNLNFGQGIPGINSGRGIGIIETRELYRIIDAAILLQGSENWTKKDHDALKTWFGDFLTWLIESPIGKDEADEHNNHGTYYDVQVINYALFTNQIALAKNQIDITKTRIKSQFQADGSQPFELERTTSWNYVNMNLAGFMLIARLAENVSVQLWNYETIDHKNIRKGIDWLIPYLKKNKTWDHKQIKKISYTETAKILKIASQKYRDTVFDPLAKEISFVDYDSDYFQLVF